MVIFIGYPSHILIHFDWIINHDTGEVEHFRVRGSKMENINGLDHNDIRGWVMTIVSGIGEFSNTEPCLCPERYANFPRSLRHRRLNNLHRSRTEPHFPLSQLQNRRILDLPRLLHVTLLWRNDLQRPLLHAPILQAVPPRLRHATSQRRLGNARVLHSRLRRNPDPEQGAT